MAAAGTWRARRLAVTAGASAAVVLCAAAGVAAAQPAADDALERQIEANLEDAGVADEVAIDVEDGVARLSGRVAAPPERARIEALATVNGVSVIDDRLEVDEALADRRVDRAAAQVKAEIDRDAARDKGAVDAFARALKREVGGGEGPQDWPTLLLATRLAAAAAGPLRGSDVRVAVDAAGTATLAGTIPDEGSRARALEIARAAPGVARVEDRLRIGPGAEPPPGSPR
jgi:osmotically-inducible protein OsmY